MGQEGWGSRLTLCLEVESPTSKAGKYGVWVHPICPYLDDSSTVPALMLLGSCCSFTLAAEEGKITRSKQLTPKRTRLARHRQLVASGHFTEPEAQSKSTIFERITTWSQLHLSERTCSNVRALWTGTCQHYADAELLFAILLPLLEGQTPLETASGISAELSRIPFKTYRREAASTAAWRTPLCSSSKKHPTKNRP